MYLPTYLPTPEEGSKTATFDIHIRWPVLKAQEYERIKKLAGNDKFSDLVRALLLQWLEKEENVIQDNPIGLRYEIPDSKHWIDSLCEKGIERINDDINIVDGLELLGKLRLIGSAIEGTSKKRSDVLWRMTKLVNLRDG